jgi:hypothetical protein
MIADNRLTETSVWYARLLAEQLGPNRADLAASAIFPSNLETGFIDDNGRIEAQAPFLMSFSTNTRKSRPKSAYFVYARVAHGTSVRACR